MGGDHCRAVAVNDIQHLGVFENQRSQALCGAGFAQAQVERVQVHVAGVFQRTQVQVALQVLAHAGLVEQSHLVTHAASLGLVAKGTQLVHVRRLHGRMQVPVLEVAGNAVLVDPLLDDLVAAPAQVPDEIVDVVTQGGAHLLTHGLVARQAAGDLAAVAPAGAPADAVGFDDRDLEPAFGQFHGAGDTGEAAADDHHIDADLALQHRVLGRIIEAGGVVRGTALGRAFEIGHGSSHENLPVKK
ncbi:hypothetical protein D9M71_225020 [compost metagenome]